MRAPARLGGKASRRAHCGDQKLIVRPDLGHGQAPGLIIAGERDGHSAQIPLRVAQCLRQLRDHARRRVIGDKVTDELCGDMRRGGRMQGDIGERRFALPHPGLRIGLAKQDLRARFVPI